MFLVLFLMFYACPTRASLERVMGIGPTQPAWKAGTLPLSYTRTVLGGQISIANSTHTQKINTTLNKSSIYSYKILAYVK